MGKRLLFLATVLAVFLSACGKENRPDEKTVAGTYQSTNWILDGWDSRCERTILILRADGENPAGERLGGPVCTGGLPPDPARGLQKLCTAVPGRDAVLEYTGKSTETRSGELICSRVFFYVIFLSPAS